jgi:hypothetical protein
MSNEWYLLKTALNIDLKIDDSRLPYFTRYFAGKRIENLTFIARLKEEIPPAVSPSNYLINISTQPTPLKLDRHEKYQLYIGETSDINFNTLFNLSVSQTDLPKLEELMVLVRYSIK